MKTDLSWLPSIFENYKINLEIAYRTHTIGLPPTTMPHEVFDAKIEAANELLSNIKQFIKDANSLTKE